MGGGLVERAFLRDEQRQGGPRASPRAPLLLRERGRRAWVAEVQHRVETAHINAQLEGIRGHHAQQPAGEELCLDRAARLLGVAGAVALQALGLLGRQSVVGRQ